MRRVISFAVSVVLLAALGLAGLAVVRLAGATLESGVYRARLQALAGDYQRLRSRYDSIVAETAVTELIVEQGSLSVSIRTAAGELVRIATPFDPTDEIYVDYVVRGGRLWIRRVFDAATAPDRGVVIDPALARLDWAGDSELSYGKATYRALSEGRWVVTATGNGALGLAPATPGEATVLEPPPELRKYPPAPAEAQAALQQLSSVELARAAVGWLRGKE